MSSVYGHRIYTDNISSFCTKKSKFWALLELLQLCLKQSSFQWKFRKRYVFTFYAQMLVKIDITINSVLLWHRCHHQWIWFWFALVDFNRTIAAWMAVEADFVWLDYVTTNQRPTAVFGKLGCEECLKPSAIEWWKNVGRSKQLNCFQRICRLSSCRLHESAEYCFLQRNLC